MACSVLGCTASTWAGGMCSRHYNRLRATGTTDDGPSARGSLAERFWRRIEKRGPDDCWLWTGKSRLKGYGYIGIGGKFGRHELSHRVAWTLTHGPISEDGPGYHGYVVMHTCDNRLCCNPAHLRLATQAENVADMHAKARGYTGPRLHGSEHGMAKLTEDLVQEIKTSPESGAVIARRLGMTRGTINRIRRGNGWQHVAVEMDRSAWVQAGEQHHGAKLTEAQVREIRDAPQGTHGMALHYGISYSALKNIRARKSWRHVT